MPPCETLETLFTSPSGWTHGDPDWPGCRALAVRVLLQAIEDLHNPPDPQLVPSGCETRDWLLSES
jgi:hypothetical protein